MRALLLVLLGSTAAYADKTVIATGRLRISVPDDAALRETTDVADGALAALTYDLEKDDAAIDIQRGVPDGSCATVVAAAADDLARAIAADNGATLTLALERRDNAMVASGAQKGSHGWRSTAIATTCRDNEVVTITAMSNGANTQASVARMAAIANIALASLAPIGAFPIQRVGVDGIHTIEIPAPAYRKQHQAPGFETYAVAGMATFGVAREAVTTSCSAWLDKMQHGLEKEAAAKDDENQTVSVERVGDLVIRVGRQRGVKRAVAGKWFANVSASACKDGLAFTLAGTSYDGATPSPELPGPAAKRVQAILVRAAQSVR